MKFAEPRPFADPEAATRKLVEIANAIETAQDGRIQGPPRGTEKPPPELTLRFPGRPPKFAPGKPTCSRQVGGPGHQSPVRPGPRRAFAIVRQGNYLRRMPRNR